MSRGAMVQILSFPTHQVADGPQTDDQFSTKRNNTVHLTPHTITDHHWHFDDSEAMISEP